MNVFFYPTSLRRFVFMCLPIFWGTIACAQNMAIEKFVGDRALPSEELYDIEEDDFGNIWLASDVGLIKITGNSVHHYTRNDGLYEDVVLDLIKGPNNIIWATGLKGTISMVRNDSILPMPVNDLLPARLGSDPYVYDEAVDARGNLYITFNWCSVFMIEAETGYRTFKAFDGNGICNFLLDGQILRMAPCYNTDIFYNGRLFPIPNVSREKIVDPWNQDYVSGKDTTIYISYRKNLVEIKRITNARSIVFDELILSIQEIDNTLYVGKRYSGFCRMPHDGDPVCDDDILSDKSVTGIAKDREGNLWFTTLEKGLYVCRSPQFENIYEGEISVRALVPKGPEMKVLADNQTLFGAGGTSEELMVPPSGIASSRVADVLYFPKGAGVFEEYVITPHHLSYKKSGGGYDQIMHGLFYLRNMKPLYDTSGFVVYGNMGVMVVEDRKVRYRSIQENVMDVVCINDSLVWLGTLSSGIWKLYRSDNGWTCRQWGEKYRINSFAFIKNKFVAVGTNDHGVLLLDLQGCLLGHIKNTPARIQALQYKDETLYIGTKEGLYIHDFVTRQNLHFNATNMLPFNEVVGLDVQGDMLYIAGKYQVVKIGFRDLKALRPLVNIRIKGVTVNDESRDPLRLDSLAHDRNYFSFNVENSSFRAAKNLSLRYSVFRDGKHLSTHDTRESSFSLYLKPGRYHVRIQATDLATGTNSNVVYVHVHIWPAFYQTGWFVVLVIFISALLLTLLFYVAVKAIKARELSKRKLMEKMHALENVALQNQMNPHFIFNAINSIQDYVLSNRRETAHHYLAEFAKLVRLTLNNNRKKMVTLNEELKLLNIYVSLEEQRIKDKIDLRVTMAAHINPDEVLIPSLLLQPLVENAIWHGLANTGREKWIAISFEAENEHLAIGVCDNGRGLSAGDTEHESHGLNIIRERIKLLYKKEPDFTYYHMKNNAGHTGVTVKLVLPLLADIWE